MLSLCRSYATIPTHRAATAARAASAPLQVRLRREKLRSAPPDSSKGNGKAAEVNSTQSERVARLRLSKLTERRGRIRGTRKVLGLEGKIEESVVGQRIYLPNIIFRMVRNHTLPGKPYNPFEATFRVPQSVTKTDIRSYLLAVYGVECTYIRTDNYLPSDRQRNLHRRRGYVQKKTSYKRTVVGLTKPFYFPLALEDMDGRERWLRQAELEEKYRRKAERRLVKEKQIALTQNVAHGWNLRGGQWESRRIILQNILRRKEEREEQTRRVSDLIVKMRKEGKSVPREQNQ